MNANFRRFKTVALQTMACDALKVDVSDAEDFITFCMCVSLYDGNRHYVEQWDCKAQ